jgi:hypothetical protein
VKFTGFISIFFAALLVGAGATFSTTTAAAAEMTKAEKLKALRKALGGQSPESASAHKSASKAKSIEDFRAQALDELKPEESSYSSSTTPVVATVSTREIEALDPVRYESFRVGFTAQTFRPEAKIPLVSLGEKDLNGLPAVPMWGLSLRLLPWRTSWLADHAIGLKLAVAYAGETVSLKGPTGKDLGLTKLHNVLSSAWLSQEWNLSSSKHWRWDLDLGVSRLDMIETGENPLAQASDAIWLTSMRLGPAYHYGPLSVNLDYERRVPFSRGWAKLNADSLVMGMAYGFR